MSTTDPAIRVEAGTRVTIREGTFAGMSAEVAETWSGDGPVKMTLTVFGRRG